jgi:hypothetical protein
MTGKGTYFFATKQDIETVVRNVESNLSLKYIQSGLFDTEEIQPFSSLLMEPGLGHAIAGDNNHCKRYLVTLQNIEIQIRTVPQRRGGVKYAIDSVLNPISITMAPGGVFREGILVEGSIRTISKDVDALKIYKTFEKHIKSNFKRIQEYYVGLEAHIYLKNGWRLTQSEQAPKESDLQEK